MNHYKTDLLHVIRKHNIFHISMLNRYTPPSMGHQQSDWQQTIVDKYDNWKITHIVDAKKS